MKADSEAARIHPLDRAVACLSRNSRLFSRGWGDEEILASFSSPEHYLTPISEISLSWRKPHRSGPRTYCDGQFRSPLKALPNAVATAHVRWWGQAGNDAASVMLAASRDEGYRIHESVFLPLTAHGIDLYFVENPYYGLRRNGRGPSDISVADHGLMALGMVLEARALLEYLRTRYSKLAVAGYSMGGHMASQRRSVDYL